MFVAEPVAQRALVPLAESLFDDFVVFGRLAGRLGLAEATLERYLPRAGFTLQYLAALEQETDLRFAPDSHFPFFSNTAQWSDDAPVAGYTGGPRDPRPSDVAHSLFAGWAAAAAGQYPSGHPLRAAVHCLFHEGYERALEFLMDLRACGFAPDGEAFAGVLDVLGHGRAACADDRELARRLVADVERLTNARDWSGAEVTLDWLQTTAADAWHLPGGTVLLEHALRRVEDLRAADGLDAWLIERANCDAALGALLYVLERSNQLPVTLRTMLSQLEEIKADSGGFLLMLRFLTQKGNWSGAHTLRVHEQSILLGAGGNVEVEARLRQQRVVRPRCLEGEPLEAGTLAPEWRHLSPRVVESVAAHVSDEGLDALEFLQPLPATGEAPALDDLLEALAQEGDASARGIALCRAAVGRYPWSSLLRCELAVRLDLSGAGAEACAEMVRAVGLAPSNPDLWHSLAIILRRSGAPEEARFAGVLEQFTREGHNA